MNELPEIAQLGNPILRQLAAPINNIQDENIQKLIDTLIDTANEANGVGIAAPQISSSQRLFIIASRPSVRYPHAPLMEPTAMINPKLIAHGETYTRTRSDNE